MLFPAISERPSVSPQPRRSVLSSAVIASSRILVVDDDEGQRKSAARILERAGYQVEIAEDGQAAVDRFASGETFSLVVLDMIMKDGFDGLDTFREMIAVQPTLKVLVASGHAPSERGAEIIALGAAWLPKPYTSDRLLDAIESLLKESAS